jgi:hypothetical protein
MPYRVTFALSPYPGADDRRLSEDKVRVLLGALADADVLYLKAHPEVPPLARSGVRLVTSPPGQEEWQDIPTTLRMGVGNQESLAAWRAAEDYVRTGRASSSAGIRSTQHTGENRRITFALDLFRQDAERQLSRDTLDVLLNALFQVHKLCLQAHPETPAPYASGARYMEEPPGQEEWMDVPTILKMGVCDCEEWGCWLAAYLDVIKKIPAHPFYEEQRRQDGGYLYHILTRWFDRMTRRWQTEDPSRKMGMR